MVWRGRLKVTLLNMMMEIELMKIKVANGLIRDIKGYHIHLWSSSNSSTEKSYGGYKIGRDLLVSPSLI
jgi:hypothetical protein